MAAPVVIAVASGFDPAGAGASRRTATLPAAPLGSDVLVGWATCHDAGGVSITWPAGWTELRSFSGFGGTTASLAIARGSAGQATQVVSRFPGSTEYVSQLLTVHVVQVRGAGTSRTINPAIVNGGAPPIFTWPSVTPPAEASLLLAFCRWSNAYGATSTPVPPYTQDAASTSNNGGISSTVLVLERTVAVPAGSYQPNMNVSGPDQWTGAQVVMLPDLATGFSGEPGGGVW